MLVKHELLNPAAGLVSDTNIDELGVQHLAHNHFSATSFIPTSHLSRFTHATCHFFPVTLLPPPPPPPPPPLPLPLYIPLLLLSLCPSTFPPPCSPLPPFPPFPLPLPLYVPLPPSSSSPVADLAPLTSAGFPGPAVYD